MKEGFHSEVERELAELRTKRSNKNTIPLFIKNSRMGTSQCIIPNLSKQFESKFDSKLKKGKPGKSKSTGKIKNKLNNAKSIVTDRILPHKNELNLSKKQNSKKITQREFKTIDNTFQDAIQRFKMLFSQRGPLLGSSDMSQLSERDNQIISSVQQKISMDNEHQQFQSAPISAKKTALTIVKHQEVNKVRKVQQFDIQKGKDLVKKKRTKSKVKQKNTGNTIFMKINQKNFISKSHYSQNSRKITQTSLIPKEKNNKAIKKTKEIIRKPQSGEKSSKSRQKKRNRTITVTTFLERPKQNDTKKKDKITRQINKLIDEKDNTEMRIYGNKNGSDQIRSIFRTRQMLGDEAHTVQSFSEQSQPEKENLQQSSQPQLSCSSQVKIRFEKEGPALLFSTDGKQYFVVNRSKSSSSEEQSDQHNQKVNLQMKRTLNFETQSSKDQPVIPQIQRTICQHLYIDQKDQKGGLSYHNGQGVVHQASLSSISQHSSQRRRAKVDLQDQFDVSDRNHNQDGRKRLLLMQKLFREQQNKWCDLRKDLQNIKHLQSLTEDKKRDSLPEGHEQFLDIEKIIQKVSLHCQTIRALQIVDMQDQSKQNSYRTFHEESSVNQSDSLKQKKDDKISPQFMRSPITNKPAIEELQRIATLQISPLVSIGRNKPRSNYDEAPIHVKEILRKNFQRIEKSPKGKQKNYDGSRKNQQDFDFEVEKQRSECESVSREISQKQLLEDLQIMGYAAENLQTFSTNKKKTILTGQFWEKEQENNTKDRVKLLDNSPLSSDAHIKDFHIPSANDKISNISIEGGVKQGCDSQPSLNIPLSLKKDDIRQCPKQGIEIEQETQIKYEDKNDLTPMKILSMLQLQSDNSKETPCQALIQAIEETLIRETLFQLSNPQLSNLWRTQQGQVRPQTISNNIQILQEWDLQNNIQRTHKPIKGQLVMQNKNERGETVEFDFDQVHNQQVQEDEINTDLEFLYQLQISLLDFMTNESNTQLQQNHMNSQVLYRQQQFMKRLMKPLGLRTRQLIKFMRRLMQASPQVYENEIQSSTQRQYIDCEENNFGQDQLQGAQYEPVITIPDICDFEQKFSLLFIRKTPSGTGYQQFFNQAIFDLTNLFMDDLRPYGRRGLPPICFQHTLDRFQTPTPIRIKQYVHQGTEQILSIKLGLLHFNMTPEQAEQGFKQSLVKFNLACCRQLQEQWSNNRQSQFEVLFELMGDIEAEVILSQARILAGLFISRSFS